MTAAQLVRGGAVVFLMTFVRPAAADEAIRHVVKAGDSCAGIAQRYYGDARFVELLHGANPEIAKNPPPHVLREGTVVVVPPKPAAKTGPDAQLTAVRNQVDVLSPEKKPGKPNDPLFRGNRVSTEASSAADVTFRDETQVKLGERTLVIILGDARAAATRVIDEPAETTLVTGNLRAFMSGPKKDAPGARVTTDAANVKIYGETQVSSDPAKTTRVAVYQGSSTIDAKGTTREVGRGFGSKAELGRSPTAPRPLPLPPIWTTPPSLTLFESPTSVIVAEYGAREGSTTKVSAWHVQLARDGIFRDVVVDTRVPPEVKRLEAQPSAPGRYYMRVSAIDDDAFEGPFSTTERTIVVAVRAARLEDGRRRLTIAPPDAFCVRVGNVPLVTVERPFVTLADEPVHLRCAPNASDPTTRWTLDAK